MGRVVLKQPEEELVEEHYDLAEGHSAENRWSSSVDGSDASGQPDRVVVSAMVIEQGG